jgi:uncharacterized protein with WD repeat
MKIQIPSLGLLFLFLGLFCAPVVDAQESYRLIFIIPDEKTPTLGTLMAMDLYGVQTTFSDQTIDIFRHSISPDHQKIAAKDTDNNLIILDTDGEVIFRAYFEALNNNWQKPWSVHGWQDENTLVLVGSVDDKYKFYQLDLTASPSTLNEMVALNSYLKSIYADPKYLIISPSYRYVMTPHIDEQNTKAIVWDLQTATEHNFPIFTSWQIVPPFTSWSHAERSIALASQDANIYLYRHQLPLIPLTKVDCNVCWLDELTWSPNDELLVYWQKDTSKDQVSLMVVEISTGIQEQLASTTGTGSIGKIYWSPDGNYVVYLSDIPHGSRSDLVMGVVNVSKRTHFTKEIPDYLQIVGWLFQ